MIPQYLFFFYLITPRHRIDSRISFFLSKKHDLVLKFFFFKIPLFLLFAKNSEREKERRNKKIAHRCQLFYDFFDLLKYPFFQSLLINIHLMRNPLLFLVGKNVRIFCTAKDSHIFSTKNNSGFDNVVGMYFTK